MVSNMKKIKTIGVCAALMLAQPVAVYAESQKPVVAQIVPQIPDSVVQFPAGMTVPKLADVAGNAEIQATAYAVYDMQSGVVLAEKGLNERIEPASLTKLMTAYLVFQAIEQGKLTLEQKFTVSDAGFQVEGSRMFLDKRVPATVQDLLLGLIVQSGNDAAITLAEAVSGSEAAFVERMNQEAARLGMKQTHFENSVGYPGAQHYTSVRDLLILSEALIRHYPQHYAMYSVKTFRYNGIEQANRNTLLWPDPKNPSANLEVDGLKTGHTSSAGYNLIASSKRNGRRVISVVIGTSGMKERAAESSKLLNWALTSFDTVKVQASGSPIGQATVYKGSADEVDVGFVQDVYLTLPRGTNQQFTPILETVQPVLAPFERGQVLGQVRFVDAQQNEVAVKPVYALAAVEEAGWFGRFVDSIVLWFKSLFSGE